MEKLSITVQQSDLTDNDAIREDIDFFVVRPSSHHFRGHEERVADDRPAPQTPEQSPSLVRTPAAGTARRVGRGAGGRRPSVLGVGRRQAGTHGTLGIGDDRRRLGAGRMAVAGRHRTGETEVGYDHRVVLKTHPPGTI